MIRLKLNGKKYECPSCMEEVKVRQWVRILKEWEPEKDIADRDYFILLGILTDSNFSSLDATLENQVTLTSVLGWVVTQPFTFKTDLPKVLQIGDKKVDIPRDPRDLSIGQNIHLRRIIDKSAIIEENISIAVAIYLQPIMDNSLFNLPRAIEIAKQIDEMPISVIHPIGFFLLRRVSKFGEMPMQTLPLLKINLNTMLNRLLLKWRKSTR